MHIKEIILDGFKSYGRRTIAGPFDKEFNAITGLNGSGKSNILDSICFVLGISKLAQVRVANMQVRSGVAKVSVYAGRDGTARGLTQSAALLELAFLVHAPWQALPVAVGRLSVGRSPSLFSCVLLCSLFFRSCFRQQDQP
jgi:predicted ATPase